MRILEDVSVIGFSGFNCDFRLDTKLAGIKYRYGDMVEKALELIIDHREWFDCQDAATAPEVKMNWNFENSGSVK